MLILNHRFLLLNYDSIQLKALTISNCMQDFKNMPLFSTMLIQIYLIDYAPALEHSMQIFLSKFRNKH